jgi:hypothetical protein
MAGEIKDWIENYKKAGGTVVKDSRENDAVPIENLIEVTERTFEQANQFINSLNLDMNGDQIISIADFPNGKLNFQGQEIDVKLFGLTENTSITVVEFKEKLKFLQSPELKQSIREAINSADTQNVGINGEQNDGYITLAELQELANKQKIVTQSTSENSSNNTATSATTTSQETAITNADGSSKTAGEVWKENKGLMLGAGGVILGGLMAFFTGGSGWLMLLFGLLGFAGGAIADNGGFDGWGDGSESSQQNTETKAAKEKQRIQEVSIAPEVSVTQKMSYQDTKQYNMIFDMVKADNKIHRYQLTGLRNDGSDDLRIIRAEEVSADGKSITAIRNFQGFTVRDAEIPENCEIQKGSKLANYFSNVFGPLQTSAPQHSTAKITQQIQEQAKDAAQNTTNLPVNQACITDSISSAYTCSLPKRQPLAAPVSL